VVSEAFQTLYISNLASMIGLPSSAIVINDIVEEETTVILTEKLLLNQTRVVVKGYRMTFTVTATNTSISALSSALVASQAPLNAILVDRGYTNVLLGSINGRTFTRPTAQPTTMPSNQLLPKKTYPYVIILIVVSSIAIVIAVIAATFYSKPAWKESILSYCLPSNCCNCRRVDEFR
jgi:hypothetical protein